MIIGWIGQLAVLEKGFVKSRNLLGIFTASASRPAVKKPIREGCPLDTQLLVAHRTGFYNKNHSKITNRYE